MISNRYNCTLHDSSIEKSILNICKYEFEIFLKKSNVTGIGLGNKEVRGVVTKEKCITVFVKEKYPISCLRFSDIIPTKYKGIKTDVIVSGIFQFATFSERVRPVTGGYSISPETDQFSGTFGCLVCDSNNTLYMLSCNHVMAKNILPIGTPIIQPGYIDGGRAPQDVVATLSKYIPIVSSNESSNSINYVDCAIAKLTNVGLVSPAITQVGIPTGVNIVTLGQAVKKSGRSTELSFGTVQAIGATVEIITSTGSIITFTEQIILTNPTMRGDSGAILLNIQNEAVGLVIGTNSLDKTISNTINNVLSKLEVRIVTS